MSHAIFRSTGVPTRHALEVDSLEMAKHLVLEGLGLAFLPIVAVQRERDERRLVTIDIEGAEPLTRQIAAIYRRNRLQSPLGHRVVEPASKRCTRSTIRTRPAPRRQEHPPNLLPRNGRTTRAGRAGVPAREN